MKQIIIKYLTNEVTVQELEQLKSWLENPNNQSKFKKYIKNQYHLNKLYAELDTEKAYSRILEQIKAEPTSSKTRKLYPDWLKYAAIFMAFLATGYGLYYFSAEPNTTIPSDNHITLQLEDGSEKIIQEQENSVITGKNGILKIKQQQDQLVYAEEESDTAPTTNAAREAKSSKFNVLTVPYGKRFELKLADGTVVLLNAGTQLKYPVSFTHADIRKVYLEGEAFFKVEKDEKHPFVVHTSKMNIRVLGTQFNVHAYNDDPETNAVLVSGEIAAYPEKSDYKKAKSVFVKPGQQALLKNGGIEVNEVNLAKYTAWTSGNLVFVDDSFQAIVKQLERSYNVRITNNFTALNDKHFTGSFKKEEVAKVLETFQAHTNFDFNISHNHITISEP